MKKDKITAQDIIDSLAENGGRTKKVSEDFFKAFISSIEEALQNREQVKVKDFGTFKLNWIAPRKSVNVQTGEHITIEGYYRVTFTPDNSLKKIVNAPFEHLETVVLDEEKEQSNLKKSLEETNTINTLKQQADEIKGILNEIQEIPATKIVKEEKKEKEEVVVAQKENLVEQTEKEEAPLNNKREENNTPISVPERKKKRWLVVLLICLLICIGGVIVFYFTNEKFNEWVRVSVFHKTEIQPDHNALPLPIDETNVASEEQQVLEEKDVSDELENAFNSRLKNVEYITTIKLSSGGRLAYYAEKYYGSPHFWVYIYEVNKEEAPNPNFILQGTSIKIPKLNEKLIDKNNPMALKKAKELEELYLK